MLPTIATGNVASALGGAYEVANSCRFNDGDSAYMSRTLGTPTDPEKWTWSCWVKRSTLGATQDFMSYDSGSTLQENFAFDGDDNLRWYHRTSGGTAYHLKTNRKFRDASAWYHLLIVYDSSQATASNRVKFFVNGTQETSFATSDYPAQDVDSELNKANAISLYRWAGGSEYFDGYIAENVFCDGQAYTTTNFGEFDEDSPTIWKPIDVSGLTFGTNGFYLDFEDSANLGNDANGGTDWAESNLAATDQATDTPTNNFATLNPLNQNPSNQFVLENGNLSVASSTAVGTKNHGSSTIGVSSGKWYCEFKVDSGSYSVIGVSYNPSELARNNQDCGYYSSGWGYYQGLGTIRNNNSGSAYGDTLSAGDILGIALDLDNSKLYFAKNGVWQNSGDPTSGATGTGAVSITSGETYFFVTGDADATTVTTTSANFGNPPFTISSGNSDGNSRGNFEYEVPDGYFALCTSNLATEG